jgi:hypothetical protein
MVLVLLTWYASTTLAGSFACMHVRITSPVDVCVLCVVCCVLCFVLQASDGRFSTLTSDFDAAMGPLFALLVARV